MQDENIINGDLHYDDPDPENTNPASRILLLLLDTFLHRRTRSRAPDMFRPVSELSGVMDGLDSAVQ